MILTEGVALAQGIGSESSLTIVPLVEFFPTSKVKLDPTTSGVKIITPGTTTEAVTGIAA